MCGEQRVLRRGNAVALRVGSVFLAFVVSVALVFYYGFGILAIVALLAALALTWRRGHHWRNTRSSTGARQQTRTQTP